MKLKRELLATSQLLERGWTKSLIAKYLIAPDEERVNPHYRSGPPMRLYNLARIEPLEQTNWFQAAKAKRAIRSAAAQKAVETKRERAIDWAESVDINIPQINNTELKRAAIERYNDRLDWESDYEVTPATIDSDPDFLHRITVNYIRHDLTDYDSLLANLYGTVGVDEAYEILRERVDDEIRYQYPYLAKAVHEAEKRWRERQRNKELMRDFRGF
jgi:hypothetical protein